jgi:hypothetical protein
LRAPPKEGAASGWPEIRIAPLLSSWRFDGPQG